MNHDALMHLIWEYGLVRYAVGRADAKSDAGKASLMRAEAQRILDRMKSAVPGFEAVEQYGWEALSGRVHWVAPGERLAGVRYTRKRTVYIGQTETVEDAR